MTEKDCSQCGEVKPLDEFYRGSGRGGRLAACKVCRSEYVRKRYANDVCGCRTKHKARYAENREAIKAADREYYAQNRETILARKREYDAANPDKRRALKAKRRATKRDATPDDACLATIGNVYAIAAALSERTDEDWHVDHTVPLARGGLHHEDNLQIVPAQWNLSKKDTHTDRWEGEYPDWAQEMAVDLGVEL
jgi:hypothetical protein